MARKKFKDGTAEENILATAYTLLAKKGYADVSTREIASEAGVALSQLNYYFKTKDKLYRAVIDMAVRRLLDELKGIFSKG